MSFSRNVTIDCFASCELYTGTPPFSRIGFFRLSDEYAEADALSLRADFEGW